MSGAEALIIGGTGLNMLGQYRANLAQAGAEERNARYLQEQADFMAATARRDEQLLRSDREQVKGAQRSAFGSSGVLMTGSALEVIADTEFKTEVEASAIRKEAKIREQLARARARDARDAAGTLKSTEYNLMQAGGTILSTAGQFAARS